MTCKNGKCKTKISGISWAGVLGLFSLFIYLIIKEGIAGIVLGFSIWMIISSIMTTTYDGIKFLLKVLAEEIKK